MLLWNKSNSLVNGSQGTFVGVRGDNVVVDFAEEGQVVVKKETWTNTSRAGNAIGNRTQVSLTLIYAPQLSYIPVKSLFLNLWMCHSLKSHFAITSK